MAGSDKKPQPTSGRAMEACAQTVEDTLAVVKARLEEVMKAQSLRKRELLLEGRP